MTKDEAIYLLRNTAWLAPSGNYESVEEAVEMAIEALKERSQGEWILQDTSYWRATHAGDVQVNRVNLKCSFCGWRNHEKKDYNFCPNCGSRMRGGD